MDISLGLEGTHVLITGGAGLIGTAVIQAFLAAGADITSLDISHSPKNSNPFNDNPLPLHTDITDEESLSHAWDLAWHSKGPVQVCVALAALDLSALPHVSAVDMSLDQFRRTMDVNVVGTFATAKQWLKGLRDWNEKYARDEPLLTNVSLIIVGSESGHWYVRRQLSKTC